MFILTALSCAKIPFITPPDPLYRELTESFADYDASVLVGRTIVIDPGHGGSFDGAVGKKKTREADVNLGVALELQRMLNNCGANVILTRRPRPWSASSLAQCMHSAMATKQS